MKRSKKLALLAGVINGQADKQALAKLKQMNEGCFMVVANDGEPSPTDLVETRLADQQGRSVVPYADFLKNPATYGRYCVVAD